MIILGIDPGLHKTGWGIIKLAGGECSYTACGSIHTDPKIDLPLRLLTIFHGIHRVLTDYKPLHSALEETYVNLNAKSSLYLAHARAVAMVAAAEKGVAPATYQAKTAKKTLTGDGNASKEMVAKMLLLRLNDFTGHHDKDAIDALSIAFCHAHYL
jgi:crossover junction endodeoxyribonuclease RuvC